MPGEGGAGGRARLVRWGVRLAALPVVLGVCAFFFLVRTGPGQGIVMDRLVDPALQGLVNGAVEIEGMRSHDLRRGATLVGVRVTMPSGDTVLTVDSIRTEYRWRSFLDGSFAFDDVTIFRPVLRVRRPEPDAPLNLETLLAGDDEEGAEPGGSRVSLRRVRIEEGAVRIRLPTSAAAAGRFRTETVAGALVRAMDFESIRADVRRALLAGRGLAGPEIALDDLSMDALVYDEPGRIDGLEGTVTWIDGEIALDADRLAVGEDAWSGDIVVDTRAPDGWVVTLDVSTDGFDLRRLTWMEPRIPEAFGEGAVSLVIAPDRTDFDFGSFRLAADGGSLTARGGLQLGAGGISTRGLELDLTDFRLDQARPWIGAELPVQGRITGRATLDGPAADVSAGGDFVFTPTDTVFGRTAGRFDGRLHFGEEVGFTGFSTTLDTVDFAILRAFAPDVDIGGTGRVRTRFTGRLTAGLRFTLDVFHEDESGTVSRMLSRGSILQSGDRYSVDASGDLGPLSLSAVRSYYPELPLTGELRGPFRLRGTLSDLELTTTWQTPGGQLELTARGDARNPGASYGLETDVSRFVLSSLVPGLPEETVFSGSVTVTGRGLDLDSASIRASVRGRAGRVGRFEVDTAFADLRFEDRILFVDALSASGSGVDVNAAGRLSAREGEPAGEIDVSLVSRSLSGLRPVLFGDSLIALAELEGFERDFVLLEGVDPETLPSPEDLVVEGRASGDVVLGGWIGGISAAGAIDAADLVYGHDYAGRAELTFSIDGIPSLDGQIRATLDADSFQVAGLNFARGHAEAGYRRPAGEALVDLTRSETESYRTAGTFQVDSAGGRLDVAEATFRFGPAVWELARTGVVSWRGTRMTFQAVELARTGPEPMRLLIDGTLARSGPVDFSLDLEGLELGRLARLAQREDLEIEGALNATLDIRGSAAEPVIDATVAANGLTLNGFALSSIDGSIFHEQRRITMDLLARRGADLVFQAEGVVPFDLALAPTEGRVPAGEMDLRVSADSLPASLALGLIDAVEDVQGTFDGDFTITGTVDEPAPSGTVLLDDASFVIPLFGVRYTNASGTLDLRPDGTVDVDVTVQAEGVLEVTGTVTVEPLSNPTFDLLLGFDAFRAVDRLDMEGVVSGALTLTGPYSKPRIQGFERNGRGLRVERGTLFLDELQRNAGVLDLSDRRFAALTLLDEEESETGFNPFRDSLVVEADLSVETDTWLRSDDMNVEMAGDLVVVYDRGERELVLVGTLQAIRGDYTLPQISRRFQVEGGTVEFPGTAGINPNLDITANTRVRRPNAEDLQISVNVGGTMLDPTIRLSSSDASVAQDDLISYLLTGQPSYALTSGQAASVRSTATSVLGSAGGVLGTAAIGTLTSRLGAIVAQNVGLDYFAISQPSNLFTSSSTASPFAQTTVEGGVYVQEDLFLMAVLRPLGNLDSSTSNILGGLRLEWSASDRYTVELFLEDRFLRSRAFGFQDVGVSSSLVTGFFVFREWGY